MICAVCTHAADAYEPHVGCPGETWCDCQHLPPRNPPAANITTDTDTETTETEEST